MAYCVWSHMHLTIIRARPGRMMMVMTRPKVKEQWVVMQPLSMMMMMMMMMMGSKMEEQVVG